MSSHHDSERVTADFVRREILQLRLDLAKEPPAEKRLAKIEENLNGVNIKKIANDLEALKSAILSPDKVGEMISAAMSSSHARTWSTRTRIVGILAALATVGAFVLNIYIALK